MTFFRFIGSVHFISVELSRANLGQINMPDLVGMLGHGNAGFSFPVRAVEQAQFDFRGIFREQ